MKKTYKKQCIRLLPNDFIVIDKNLAFKTNTFCDVEFSKCDKTGKIVIVLIGIPNI